MPCLSPVRSDHKNCSIDGKSVCEALTKREKEGALISGAEMICSSKSNTSGHHPDDESEENEAKAAPPVILNAHIK